MTIKEFAQLKEMLDNFGVPYEEGNYYSDNGLILGHWLTIHECDLDTDEITMEDKKYNNS